MTSTEKPRVMLVAHGVHDRGGMEHASAEFIRHAATQFDFTVVSAELEDDLRRLVHDWIRVRVPRRPISLKFVLFWIRAATVVRRADVDLIHTVGAIVPNRVDVASIHFCHAGLAAAERASEYASPAAPPLRRINTFLVRRLSIFAERWSYRPDRLRELSAVSEGVAVELSTHYRALSCSVTPNGVDHALFRPSPDQRSELRDALGTLPTTTVALFVGGDWSRKGLTIAILAVATVRAKGLDMDLWIVGAGNRRRFEHLAVENGIGDHVHFHGVRHDTERFYQAADIFLFPSAYEAFSLACLEAAASGLPLVVPPISGASEIVGQNEGGLIVDRSVPSVADALTRLSDPEYRLFLGTRACARVQQYTWERSAATMTEIYQRILGPNPSAEQPKPNPV